MSGVRSPNDRARNAKSPFFGNKRADYKQDLDATIRNKVRDCRRQHRPGKIAAEIDVFRRHLDNSAHTQRQLHE